MKRRTVLTSVTAAAVTGTLTGCLAGGDTSGSDGGSTDTETDTSTESPTQSPTETSTETATDTPAETATSTPSSGAIKSKKLRATGDCSNSGTASVAFESNSVVVTGCIQGPNGCHQPVLESATMDGDTLNIVVTTEAEGDACTQALVQRGYEVTVSCGGDLPEKVVVVHKSMGEQSTAATKER